jgi:hypothetical protein
MLEHDLVVERAGYWHLILTTGAGKRSVLASTG